MDLRYIPLRKQKVLTRAGYIGLQMRINEQMGRGPSIAGRDIIRALELITRV